MAAGTLYLTLSELFYLGFAFHPYGGYFLTVHSAAAATTASANDDMEGGGRAAVPWGRWRGAPTCCSEKETET